MCIAPASPLWLIEHCSSLIETKPMQKASEASKPRESLTTAAAGITLRVIGFSELDATNSILFRDQARAALTPDQNCLEVDLSKTRFVDSSGLGALIALYKTMCARGGKLRLLNPTDTVRQMLELTRMQRLFEIVHG